MSGDTTVQSLKRLTWLPERDATDNGNLIAGQDYFDVYFSGGYASNIELDNPTFTNPVPLLYGGLGSSFTDPNADRLLFWDDSAGAVAWLTAGSGLVITDTTISVAGAGLGDVTGPSSSTANAIAVYNGTTGKVIKNSGAQVDASGNITGNNLAGVNTGDQTITLTGDVTGSGTGSFAATIASGAVTSSKLGSNLTLGGTTTSGNIKAASSVDGVSITSFGGSASVVVAPYGTTDTYVLGVLRVPNAISILAPASSSSSGLRIPHGSAPTSPSDGDVWTTTDGMYAYINGATNLLTNAIPVNSQSAAYTLVLSDANKCIHHPAADTTARTWTIPANASVAFPIGTAITFDNDYGAGALTIAITSDTLVLVGSAGSTGSRTLATGGRATAHKVTATRWRISGTGLT